MALSEEEKAKIKERLEKIGRLSEEDRPKLTKKQKSLIKEESERINSYNAANRGNNDDFLDTSLPLYLINRLNDAGLTTTGDFGFYMDYCKNNGVLTTDDIDKLLDRISESKASLEEAKENLAKTKSRDYLSHNVESILECIAEVEKLVKAKNYEKRYNPYTDITGVSGLTGFDTDIRALKNIINAKAFDKDLQDDIERRQKDLDDLKDAINKEYHEIKNLDPNNIEEIKLHAAKYNELTSGYHKAESYLQKLTKQRERTGLLSFDDITRAQNLSNQIYDSLNFAKVYGFSSPELSALNSNFEKLNNSFIMYRELIVNATNLEKEVTKKDNELNKLLASFMVSVDGKIDTQAINKTRPPKKETPPVAPATPESPEIVKPSNDNTPEASELEKEEKKVIFIGYDNSANPFSYKHLEIGDLYTVKSESEDSYVFDGVVSFYPKSSFMTEEEFQNMYTPGKTVYLYVPKENVDLIDDELKLNTPYTIKSVDNDKITLNEVSGTYPVMTFVIPETWNYIGYSLTGLKTNDPKFAEALNNMYYGKDQKKPEKPIESTEGPKVGDKLLYFGLLKNRTIPYYPGLSFLSEYTIKEIINDNGNIYYKFNEISGSYSKESFITTKEHNKIYNKGMQPGKIVLYYPVTTENADPDLRLGAEYQIKEIKNGKIILENSDKEFDANDFYPCVWKDLVIHNLTGKQPIEVEDFEPIKPQNSEPLPPLPPHGEPDDDFYVVYKGNAPKGFEDYYSRVTKGEKYKVINETGNYYEIELEDHTPYKILKSYACTLKEWQERDNLVVYTGKLIKDDVCKIKDYIDLTVGKTYKIKEKTADGKYLVLEEFEDKKFPVSVFASLKKWESLTDEEKIRLTSTPRPRKVVKEETKNRTIYLTSFAIAIIALAAASVPFSLATLSVLVGASGGAIAYYIDKLKKQGKHKERKKVVKTLSDRLKDIFIDTEKEPIKKSKIEESLSGIIDNDLKGELIEEGLDEDIFKEEADKFIKNSPLAF